MSDSIHPINPKKDREQERHILEYPGDFMRYKTRRKILNLIIDWRRGYEYVYEKEAPLLAYRTGWFYLIHPDGRERRMQMGQMKREAKNQWLKARDLLER